jgi:hypothetical protein
VKTGFKHHRAKRGNPFVFLLWIPDQVGNDSFFLDYRFRGNDKSRKPSFRGNDISLPFIHGLAEMA